MTYTVETVVKDLSTTGNTTKRLSVIAWNGNPAKLDLRAWHNTQEGIRPGKGITLTDEEAETLLDALQAYFR